MRNTYKCQKKWLLLQMHSQHGKDTRNTKAQGSMIPTITDSKETEVYEMSTKELRISLLKKSREL
jgi:hypothetical protein